MTSTGGGPSGTGGKNYKQAGEDAWKKAEKVNGELFALTYGALVAQLLKDHEDASQVNLALDRLGHSLGTRLVDEFLARSTARCNDFRETGEVIARVAFRQFLNIQPNLTVGPDGKELTLSFGAAEGGDGLGSELVELPVEAVTGGLHYANILCGVIRGALEMIGMQVECNITSDPLLNPTLPAMELHVRLVKYLEGERPPGDE